MGAFTNIEITTFITIVIAIVAVQLRKKAKTNDADVARGWRIRNEFNKEGHFYVLEECRNGTSWWEICVLAEQEHGGELAYTNIDQWPQFAIERQVEIEKIIGTPFNAHNDDSRV